MKFQSSISIYTNKTDISVWKWEAIGKPGFRDTIELVDENLLNNSVLRK